MESFVNLGAAILALWMLRVAVVPPDEKHPFGYGKAEYFSAVVEGGMIVIAALAIIATALPRLIEIAVAVYIVWTGIGVMRRSVWGLMDRSLPETELESIRAVLEPYRSRGTDYHALRTRRAGRRRLVELHLLVPGEMSVLEGHRVAEEIEQKIRVALPGSGVLTHLEPIEDAASYRDQELFR